MEITKEMLEQQGREVDAYANGYKSCLYWIAQYLDKKEVKNEAQLTERVSA